MPYDPYYTRIIDGLAGSIDPDLFEACVAAIVQDDLGSVVPIRGGTDAGMDAAVADGLGAAYPLICTTSDRCLRNLKYSLNAYAGKGGRRRKAAFATSVALTRRKRTNLEEAAEGLGFELVQVFDRSAIAHRLYKNPGWARQLLGVTGEPPALSTLPPSTRPLLDQELVGRARELAQLCALSGDSLLVGQPGAGKSFLLHALALQGNDTFFVTIDDIGRIADGIREQDAKTLIVDDAHAHVECVRQLRNMRQTTRLAFRIIAATWPGDRPAVQAALGASRSAVVSLEPLSRDQLVEVIHGVGIYGPPELVRHLVDQAEGRPGLAATLAHLVIRGEVDEIRDGSAVKDALLGEFERRGERRAESVLAAFAIGGDSGMPIGSVASCLGLPVIEVRAIMSQLDHAGVVDSVAQEQLAVRPVPFRHALVRDVLFGPVALPWKDLAAMAPNPDHVVRTLIAVRAHGAAVPRGDIEMLLSRTSSPRTYGAYVMLDTYGAEWVLEARPDLVPILSQELLHQIPSTVLPLLLEAAVRDGRRLNSTPEHPLRQLEQWIRSARPGSRDVVDRRRALFRAAVASRVAATNHEVALSAICLALSPRYENCSSDPGSGDRFTFTQGCISTRDVPAVQSLWTEALDFVGTLSIHAYNPLLAVLGDWAFPSRCSPRGVRDDVYAAMRGVAIEAAQALAHAFADNAAVIHRLQRIARDAEFDLGVAPDETFETLFAGVTDLRTQEQRRERQSRISKLAKQWLSQPVEEGSVRIATLDRQADAAGVQGPRLLPDLAREVANSCDTPLAWARALIIAGAKPDTIDPFFRIAIDREDEEVAGLLAECVRDRRYAHMAAVLACETNVDPDLFERLVAQGDLSPGYVEQSVMLGRIAEHRVARLLAASRSELALRTAYGEWHAEPPGSVRESLRPQWMQAVLATSEGGAALDNQDEYLLEDILTSDALLAEAWIERYIANDCRASFHSSQSIPKIVATLNLEQRRRLLDRLTDDTHDGELVRQLVGDDASLYGLLLADDTKSSLHLMPLHTAPTGNWSDKAIMAVRAGYSPEDVAAAAYERIWTWSGDESQMWKERAAAFAVLQTHDNADLRAVGTAGRLRAEREQAECEAEERRERVRGR